MSGQKRLCDSSVPSSSSSASPEKRRGQEGGEDGGPGVSSTAGGTTAVETVIKLGGVSNSEEQDVKALQVKNRKLGESLDQRQVIEDELRERIERLETRQATDDASLLILNRYWNQFDDNVCLIGRRYDESGSESVETPAGEGRSLKPDTPEPDGDSNQERVKDRGHQGETTTSFLATLASSSSEEMEAELQERVESSQKQANRVVVIYDSLKTTVEQLKKDQDSGAEGSVWQVAAQLNTLLSNENDRLRHLTEDLQQKHSHMTSESRSLGWAVARADTRVNELQGLIEALQWDMEKIRRRENRLNTHLGEILERVNSKGYKVCGEASSVCGTITINKRKFEEMNSELEENRELAENRLSELQRLQLDLQTVNQENSNMKVSLQSLTQGLGHQNPMALSPNPAIGLPEVPRPYSANQTSQMKVELLSRAEGVVRESSEYRCLQSQFSVLYNESVGLKSQLDETRTRLNTTKTARLRQLEHMENDEVSLQRKVRTEVFQLEDTLAQVRKEYEMLRIEFEQTLAANEQAGPINREMRHLISTLQTHNQHMKGEVVKYKLRLREAQTNLSQARTKKGSAILQSQSSTELDVKVETTSPLTPAASADVTIKVESDNGSATPTSTSTSVKTEPGTETEGEIKEKEKEREREGERPTRGRGGTEEKEKAGTSNQSEEVAPERPSVIGGPKRKEVEQLKIVGAELKKAQESQREMKLLLDMYRSAPKEQRDKVQLMAAEKKAKSEAEELKQRLRDLEERERREGKKMADEEALRKIRSVEEQINILNKKLSLAKQEEDALLSEMDVTGQAFEDMQEQNIRLMQQLREKDDANFKLMSERIKSNQIHKLLKEEKEELADQLLTLKTQVDAQLQVVKKLEEKERLLQGTIGTAERELALRTQALDMNKRKTQESAVLSDEVCSQLDQVQQRLGTVREEVIENSISKEKQSFNARRAQEDISKLRRKIEKAKKPAETVRNGDDILNEEINDYKARLTCPCCNSRVKDAVLTKCFHVFCFECVKTRYDTRQRKCPKCNAAFGANDFHRIYIG
ncbi:E3 ubiquitin-protein ligase BRE1A isoform X1 [Coregonus clupeaformis]|uniref:E3 ubiquitin-protein ligase BRE1A isoform X1 n=1 Tax=Coregonus clupeaformis TaxID=59861 RepID=UPI001BE108A8|nr:E3 ubiquitin-protein ligase BRE1A isoform X1 [Coregonus clupeaformis]XP_041710231.1 E3 ubiquitin-protein ligase BRE1A isoform X1 [Coregonus clupeaformis]XP_041710239.1 E3 ubiquitin-protein ligase BRE1A isoform X1 [Coregonus clupeaformis]XP_041710247.1 E3 ubiquitin-protein ligase BRE1A isoform X1 [Coregonus clupeaformis]